MLKGRRFTPALIVAMIALAVALSGTAVAGTAKLITGSQIANGTIKLSDIHPSAKMALKGARGETGAPGHAGAKGDAGAIGAPGPKGDKGAKGDDYMAGAYYAIANYDVGDTNAGAVATVACSAVTDTAISGGVQVLGLDDGANSRNTPVSSSFPGRMDWTTNKPRPNRLDGWIVQFGGTDKDPAKTKVWALCVPGLNVPVISTYTQSS